MGGHVDDGEEAHECPVVSFSLGPSCIFLVGGLTKDIEPLPLILTSGDVLILGGPSRLKFHGIPKVFVADGPPEELKPSSLSSIIKLGSSTTTTSEIHSVLNIHHSGCPCFLDLIQKEEEDEDNPVCNCGYVTVSEIQRTLKVLCCARINVNLRQVYRTSDTANTRDKDKSTESSAESEIKTISA